MPTLVEIGPSNTSNRAAFEEWTTLIQKSTYINESCYIV